MKIKPEHLAYLRENIQPLDTAGRRNEYRKAGFSVKRYGRDLLYDAALTPWICANLYPYCNDDHIDTALRSIVGSTL